LATVCMYTNYLQLFVLTLLTFSLYLLFSGSGVGPAPRSPDFQVDASAAASFTDFPRTHPSPNYTLPRLTSSHPWLPLPSHHWMWKWDQGHVVLTQRAAPQEQRKGARSRFPHTVDSVYFLAGVLSDEPLDPRRSQLQCSCENTRASRNLLPK
jgi:hypothetical protein